MKITKKDIDLKKLKKIQEDIKISNSIEKAIKSLFLLENSYIVLNVVVAVLRLLSFHWKRPSTPRYRAHALGYFWGLTRSAVLASQFLPCSFSSSMR